MKTTTKLWIGIGALALLSPIGIFLPNRFKAGSAWGEWGAEEFNGMVGYIPNGLEKIGNLWKAQLPDYAVKGLEQHPELAYILSAVLGIALCAGAVYFFSRILSRKTFGNERVEHGEKSKRVS